MKEDIVYVQEDDDDSYIIVDSPIKSNWKGSID